MPSTNQATAEIDYTVEVCRGRSSYPIRKTKVVRASREKLPDAILRASEKLCDVGAYQLVIRYEVQP